MSQISFKKITAWLVSVLMVLCVMTFVGCSKDDDNNGGGPAGSGDLVGTWQIEAMVVGKIDWAVFNADGTGHYAVQEDVFYWRLDEDGTVTVVWDLADFDSDTYLPEWTGTFKNGVLKDETGFITYVKK
ncbi:MAG: hypothetical protein LBH98_09640 [Chitinispirillales bacterium]|jgi:hypothetical protein|nr:hypothetical protein [Chitinispirillales bacterium]